VTSELGPLLLAMLTLKRVTESYVWARVAGGVGDRDVRTRSAASRNVDLETRYVIVCVGACCGRGGGRKIIK
jgi:hypothetical protein